MGMTMSRNCFQAPGIIRHAAFYDFYFEAAVSALSLLLSFARGTGARLSLAFVCFVFF